MGERARHDLNNLFQVLIGQVAMMRRRAGRGEDVRAELEELERVLWDAASALTGRTAPPPPPQSPAVST